MKRFLIALWLATAALAAFAVPTVEQVQAEIGKGNYAQAEVLMRDVVTAKPGSARAHYVYAEILAHDRRFDMAAEEAAKAKQLDPSLKFTQADKFNAFAQLIEREQAAAKQRSAAPAERAAPRAAQPAPTTTFGERAAVESGSGGVPGWVWGGGLLLIAVIAWRALASRRQAGGMGMAQPGATYGASPAGFAGQQPVTPGYGGGNVGGNVGGYGPGYAPGGYGTGPARAGGGLLGTGMAVAGGVAAGMLAEKLFEGHRDSASGNAAAAGAGGLTGNQFNDGAVDDPAARELEQRPVDMGTGDEWGGDAGGGDVDTGSSGGDDGW